MGGLLVRIEISTTYAYYFTKLIAKTMLIIIKVMKGMAIKQYNVGIIGH